MSFLSPFGLSGGFIKSLIVGTDALLRLRICFLNLELFDSFGEVVLRITFWRLSLEPGVCPADFVDVNKFLIGVSNFFGEFVVEAASTLAGGVYCGTCCNFGDDVGVNLRPFTGGRVILS